MSLLTTVEPELGLCRTGIPLQGWAAALRGNQRECWGGCPLPEMGGPVPAHLFPLSGESILGAHKQGILAMWYGLWWDLVATRSFFACWVARERPRDTPCAYQQKGLRG